MNTNPYGKIFAVYRWRSLLTGVLILGGLLGAGIAESASLYVGVSPSPAAATVTPGYTNVSTFGTIPLVATDISPAYTFSYWALYACTVPAYAEINNSISNHTVYIKVADTNDDAESFATAVYVNNLCTLVVASSPTNGGFTSPAGSNTYLKGTTVSVSETPSAVPAPGYEFLGWSGAPYTPLFGNSIQVVMDSDYSLTASFIKLWKLSQSFRLGPSDNIPFVFSLRDQVYTNISIPSVIAEQSDSQRFRCNGWSDGSGSVIPISRSGANFTSINLISTTNSGLTWSWAQQYKVDATNTEEGYITIQELSSDNDPNDRWADTGTSVRVSVAALDPSKFEPDYVLVNGEIQYLSPVYQVNVTVTNPVTIVPFLRVVIQMDPGFIAYMHRFGLNAGAPNQRASDDPDHDGLSNLNEYLLSNTNRGWYYNPINSDTDGDGMDDLYETYSVDSTNLTEAGRATNRPAATDNGAGVPDNGPVGNPDGDYQWSTTDGYMQPGRPLMNIEEYIGPDGIAPYTMTQTVSFGDALYPFPANPVGYRPDVVIRVAVPADTGDQSKGNTAYTDRDVFDDGYEYSWDQWQQKYSGSNEVVIIGVTNGMADYLAFPLFLSRYNLVTNGVAIYITNTVPDWATSRVFNPGRTDIPENGPDYDVLYNYNDGKVSFFYYSAYLEYNAWQTNAFTVGISNAPHSIRMDFPPIMPNGMLPRRCSHPFLWDVDVDGLPDGWEVIFGFDPWTPSKFDRLHFPINVDAAGPNDPYPNDPEGSDPLEDGTLEHPFDSIQKAIDSVQGIPGMTVLVHDGTYTMRGNYGVSTRGTRIIVESENGSDFTHIDTLAAGPGFIFSSGETTNTVVRGFSIHTWAGYVDESGVILNGSSPMLEDLRIWDCGNYGIVCSNSAAPVINNFTVEDCNGGIRIIGSAPIISRGAVISNSAYRGGGLLIESGASPAIINCLIAGNVSETDGGGVSVSAGCAPSLINCTIADNVAATRGGGLASSGSPILRNIVLWANSASSNPGLYRASGTLDAQYSDLQGGWIGSNINTNPLFMDAGNYQLKFGSPCIDSGSGAGAPNNDLDWVARPSDGNFDGTNGFDMGCYEYNSGIAISGYDGLLDSWKYQCGIYPTNHVAELDLDHDGMTTWQEWLAGCNPMDSNSVFRFTKSESDPSGQGMIIRWPSISNRFYDLGRATNLLAGTNTFIILSGASNMPATPMENSYTDTVQGVGPYFYKINVHQ